jgi:hypothetical protein
MGEGTLAGVRMIRVVSNRGSWKSAAIRPYSRPEGGASTPREAASVLDF